MSNLIDRQAAINIADELKDDLPDDPHLVDCILSHNEGILEYQTKLSLLSSVQPPVFETKLDGTESDVEILSKLRCQFNCFNGDEIPWYEALSRAIKALRSEPERKKGKWIIDGHHMEYTHRIL